MNLDDEIESKITKRRLNLLVCVIDCNSIEWGHLKEQSKVNSQSNSQCKKKFCFSVFINYFLIFIKFYLFSSNANRVVIITSSERIENNRIIFPRPPKPSEINENIGNDKKRKRSGKTKISVDEIYENVEFEVIQKIIIEELVKIGETFSDPKKMTPSKPKKFMKNEEYKNYIGNSISHGLCYINSYVKRNKISVVKSRMLIFQISSDNAAQYRYLMNCMFCAKNLNVMIDSCVLSQVDSVWLQQVCKYTNGIYFKPDRNQREGLLQYFLQIYSVDSNLRKVIQLPDQDITDFRVTSFDTKKKIDQGFICSECLAILSVKKFICPVCGSRFASKRRKRTIRKKDDNL